MFSLGGLPIEEIDRRVKTNELITTFPAYPPLYVGELTGKKIAILGSGKYLCVSARACVSVTVRVCVRERVRA